MATTTIINPAPGASAPDNSGIGFIVGLIVLLVFVGLVFFYALPFFQGLGRGGGIQVNVPVPKSINVNVQQTK